MLIIWPAPIWPEYDPTVLWGMGRRVEGGGVVVCMCPNAFAKSSTCAHTHVQRRRQRLTTFLWATAGNATFGLVGGGAGGMA